MNNHENKLLTVFFTSSSDVSLDVSMIMAEIFVIKKVLKSNDIRKTDVNRNNFFLYVVGFFMIYSFFLEYS